MQETHSKQIDLVFFFLGDLKLVCMSMVQVITVADAKPQTPKLNHILIDLVQQCSPQFPAPISSIFFFMHNSLEFDLALSHYQSSFFSQVK